MGNGEERLRALIRLIPPARALRDDLDKSIHLELYAGTGDLAVGSFEGLRAAIGSSGFRATCAPTRPLVPGRLRGYPCPSWRC